MNIFIGGSKDGEKFSVEDESIKQHVVNSADIQETYTKYPILHESKEYVFWILNTVSNEEASEKIKTYLP